MPHGDETILVAEDEAALRDLIARVLGPLGYRVLLAASGAEALVLASAAEPPPALLLSDMVMPGMSGRALADGLSAAFPGIKVLLMSGHHPDDSQDAHDPAVLTKPFSPRALAHAVREALDSTG
jgi:CheY-like chemotaxis protein